MNTKPKRFAIPLSVRLVVLAVGVVAVVLFFLVGYRAWWQTPEVGTVPVTIVSTEAKDVTEALKTANIIKNKFFFRIYFAFNWRTDRLKPGGYELHPGTPYADIIEEVSKGVPKTEVSVKIIEGWTLSDIEQELVQDFGVSATNVRAVIGERADESPFDKAWRDEFSFLKSLPEGRSLEGYLYPDTYRVWKEQLPEVLIRKQLQTFQQRVGSLPLTEKSLPLKSLDEVIRLASIVEKEVPSVEDRRIVAGLFLTRLREGMMLQSDATIQYVTRSGRDRSTTADLRTNSDYNTYKRKGLPPGPIGNPSLSSIEAVLNPDIRGYRYFLTDKQGKVYYAKTLQEHANNRTKAGYNQ